MAPRAIWKGSLKVAEVVCPVAMYAAASTSQRVTLHMVNRKTGNRLRRVYADTKTDEVVEKDCAQTPSVVVYRARGGKIIGVRRPGVGPSRYEFDWFDESLVDVWIDNDGDL